MASTATSPRRSVPLSDSGPQRKVAIAMGSITILLLLGGAFWYWWSHRGDAELERMGELSSQLFGEAGEKLSGEERQRLREEMQTLRDGLSESQRREFGEARFAEMRKGFTQRIDAYFALPESQRTAYLDQQIKEMDQWRQRWQANGGGPGGRGGPPGGGPPGGGPPGGGEGRGRGGWNEDDPNGRRRAMLDRTTPEERAKFTEYFEALNERREQLGLEPIGPGRGRRP